MPNFLLADFRFLNKFIFYFFVSKTKKHYLCTRIGLDISSGISTKRESGANPEQTRYCKSYATF